MKMRRQDREVTDSKRINEIINSCNCCRVGFNDDGEVYIVPLNFGYEIKDGKYILYFHGARDGRKYNLAKSSPYVGFEMDCAFELVRANSPCEYSAHFCSIIGNGNLKIVDDFNDKKHALEIIMKHLTGRDNFEFIDKMVEQTAILKLEVTELSCKEH